MTDEHLYKILVVGEFGVGKTSLIKRYTEGVFSPSYKLTIGVDFALKSLQIGDKKTVHLQLWDIAGHERFGHMTRVYYKYAIAAICVFDLSRPATFDAVHKWIEDINSVVVLPDDSPIPILLLANKSDIKENELDESAITQFCKSRKLIGWFAVSAKDDLGVDEAMEYLVMHLLGMDTTATRPPQGELTPLVDLDEDQENNNPIYGHKVVKHNKNCSC